MLGRRAVIATAATLCGGCLGTEPDPYDEVREGITIPDDPTPPARPVRIAHWFPEGMLAPLDDRDPELEIDAYPDRATHEAAVADEVVAGQPPDLFMTVLGEELGRYVLVEEIDAIEDVIDAGVRDQFHPTVEHLMHVDGTPYALPVAAWPTNILSLDASAPNALREARTPAGFVEALEDHDDPGLALPSDGEAYLAVLSLLILGARGVATYRRIATGELFMRDLREATALLVRLVRAADKEGDGRFATEPMPGPEWQPFPGTEDVVVLDAVGFCLALRGDHPGAAADVLVRLCDPDIQDALVRETDRWPTVGQDPFVDDPFPATATVVPAVASGCGLDPDVRWRAIEVLDATEWEDPDVLAEDLAAVIR